MIKHVYFHSSATKLPNHHSLVDNVSSEEGFFFERKGDYLVCRKVEPPQGKPVETATYSLHGSVKSYLEVDDPKGAKK